MNINRTEALAAISHNINNNPQSQPEYKAGKNSNTVFADLLRVQQQAQASAIPSATAPTSAPSAVTSSAPSSASMAPAPSSSATNVQASPAAEAETGTKSSAVQEFRDYMAMSDAEKMRAAVLKEMGLTEEEFEQLPPEEQLAIEQKIVERLKQETGVSDTGFNTEAISLLLQEMPQPG
ncbi:MULTISPECIES: hypothetical protein [Thalassolituus]|uniref:hypothetical protein n=1 Tax=Thalassolituus TaxID=187492 RepID=UPI001E39DB5D|nr:MULTISPECIES: hypothetical protein [Thalassolituus]MCB2387662.1 hypothetical protein [Thalassolituus alkanivorans]MCB2424936.1 hypothetical protein [Thalassolituus alkanivorans]|tara:strand:- start:11 stop:547 length:537 start_codon:yes stop_codon:yes gene_type:complete